MHTPYDIHAKVGRMVYVKPISVASLPKELQEQVEGLNEVFSVHDAEGQQLALVPNKRLAIMLARENDYAPQPLH